MRVTIVSGIWPPDVGGPASHAPELAAFLQERGHEVEAVVTADAPPAPRPYPVHWVDRASPRGIRHARCVALIRRRACRGDVVYATSMLGRASLGARLARRPLVAKLVADEAYERARRFGLFAGDLDAFQRLEGGVRVRILRAARDRALRRAERLVCPSSYLASLAVAWGVPEERIVVLPNPAPPLPELPTREAARARFGVSGPTLAFAGRITRQKALEVALAALAGVERARLLVAGDGPELEAVRAEAARLRLGDRVRFLGPLEREGVLALLRAADASLLASSWENFPHAVVESLAVGTPVVATAVGGVAELVRAGENGLLVPPGDVEALREAIRAIVEDDALRERLASRAARSVEELAAERVYARLEEILREAAAR
ncbi:MAG: glycosyltransferase family 4 protein [Thermoleophilia bacterium]|nr:glycosyltransferase family 4 protein [Gaiellaceae bacterium]MDW8338720.1 glycosyltransferase family 4 protein [Thermoleophilia bacterium]